MKAFLLGSLASLGLACALAAQTPTPIAPSATPLETVVPSATAATPTPVPSLSPAASSSPRAEDEHGSTDKKVKRHFRMTIGDKDGDVFSDDDGNSNGDVPEWVGAVAILGVVAVFGFPVAIVAVIVFSSWAKQRAVHRTVRMMVEKGQPVPPELFVSPAGAPLRPWYDLRRGIVLLSVGFSLMMFFGLAAGWDEGVWALGLIPALIGLGYILAWRLANRHGNGFKQ